MLEKQYLENVNNVQKLLAKLIDLVEIKNITVSDLDRIQNISSQIENEFEHDLEKIEKYYEDAELPF